MSASPQQILHQYWGFSDFRPGQLDIINSVLAQHDTLAIIPTGGGKSLCFQVPGLMLGGVTLVISPLIALMKDQVDHLSKAGIKAAFLATGQSVDDQQLIYAELTTNQQQFLYCAPERLGSTNFRQLCHLANIKLVVVDEAHCISEWGHDFRPDYLQIATFLATLPSRPPVIAVTATAPLEIRQDIITQLGLKKPTVLAQPARRDNLHLRIVPLGGVLSKDLTLALILDHHQDQPVLIYAGTRLGCENLTLLIKQWFPHRQVAAYHAGLPNQQRNQIQDDFIHYRLDCIVATSAFGMGVDKPDIRCCIHYQLPTTVEEYVQEAGRAGRDRQPAWCYSLYNPISLKQQFARSIATALPDQKQRLSHRHATFAQFFSSQTCRAAWLETYFDGTVQTPICQHCDRCQPSPPPLSKLAKQSLIKFSQSKSSITVKHQLWLSVLRPSTLAQLTTIPGIGQGWIKSHNFDTIML